MDVGELRVVIGQWCWQDDVSRCDYRQVQPTQGQVLFKGVTCALYLNIKSLDGESVASSKPPPQQRPVKT